MRIFENIILAIILSLTLFWLIKKIIKSNKYKNAACPGCSKCASQKSLKLLVSKGKKY